MRNLPPGIAPSAANLAAVSIGLPGITIGPPPAPVPPGAPSPAAATLPSVSISSLSIAIGKP